jgi:hypothetical protein
MTSIELRIPKPIQALVSGEQERLLRSALRVAAKQRARELAQEHREALTHIRRYERKYGMALPEFERRKLRALNTVQRLTKITTIGFSGPVCLNVLAMP